MSVKVHFLGGEATFYANGRGLEPSASDPVNTYEVVDKDGKRLAVIPRGNVRNVDFLPDED